MRKLAFPFSLIYFLVVKARNSFYNLGIFKSRSFRTKSICVGNLSVGGTGKTPMIEYLVRFLQQKHKVAVLSRGYKRKSKGFLLADIHSTVQELGDEPFQIHSKFNEVQVAVDANRCHGIEQLETLVKPDVILLDDAFQHRKVKPWYSILLTTYANPYFSDWYLPTGDLRDSKTEAARANTIIVTKCPQDLSLEKQQYYCEQINPSNFQKVLFSYISYSKELKGDSTLAIEELKGKSIVLVTGIANALPLVSFLNSNGLVVEHLEYGDHHFFSSSEVELFNTKDLIITTEKDYMRLKGKVNNLYYLEIKLDFLNGGGALIQNEINELMSL